MGCILSTCTEMELTIGDSKTSLLEELATMRQAKFASETRLRLKNACESQSRHLSVGKFLVIKIPRPRVKHLQIIAIPEFGARVASRGVHYNLGSAYLDRAIF